MDYWVCIAIAAAVAFFLLKGSLGLGLEGKPNKKGKKGQTALSFLMEEYIPADNATKGTITFLAAVCGAIIWWFSGSTNIINMMIWMGVIYAAGRVFFFSMCLIHLYGVYRYIKDKEKKELHKKRQHDEEGSDS